MQWYVYDHYNLALTGTSFMTIDKQVSQCLYIIVLNVHKVFLCCIWLDFCRLSDYRGQEDI